MKINVKSLSRKTSTNEFVGTLTFKADNEVDAIELAALADQWVNVKGRAKQLRSEALKKYCKKHNVTVVTEDV